MNLILDLLFPKKCLGCQKLGSYFCQDCISTIIPARPICFYCQKWSLNGQTHPLCQRKYGIDGLWSLGIYQGILREAIKQFKYCQVKELAKSFIEIIGMEIIKLPVIKDQSWVIVPVPLHWWKDNNRGFNQTAVIGQLLSKKLGLGYCEALKRVRNTKPQTKFESQGRQQNIKNAFALTKRSTLNANILLIDDVWTTGSTLKECCLVLKKAGVKKVWALTLAASILHKYTNI